MSYCVERTSPERCVHEDTGLAIQAKVEGPGMSTANGLSVAIPENQCFKAAKASPTPQHPLSFPKRQFPC